MRANNTVQANLGDRTFIYRGKQGTDAPEFSMWMFSVFGGAKLIGDPAAPNEASSLLGAITARRSFLESEGCMAIFG
jgi:hypothetical protein